MAGYVQGSRQGATNRRGKAARDRQLGRVQVKILRWLLEKEVELSLVGDESQRRSGRRHGVAWVKVNEQVEERSSAVSTALRSLVKRELVVLSMLKGGRVNDVKLTTLGRATAEATTPDRSPRKIKDSIRRRFVEQHGPRSTWSDDLKMEEQHEIEDAHLEVAMESLRLGRPVKHVTEEEYGAILYAASQEAQAAAPGKGVSSAHLAAAFGRLAAEYLKKRDEEE